MKIFKNYLLATFALCMLIPMSCGDDLLDQVNSNTVSTGTFWQNADDARLAVNGMYHPITNTFFWGRIVHTGAILRSDVFNIRPFGPNTAMSHFTEIPGVSRWSTEIWSEPFKTVFRANSVLENVNDSNITDATERNGILGQAYFMRAFSYWYLVNLYGNVPVVTRTPSTDEEFFPAQSTPDQVWDQIIEDLTAAAAALPAQWEGNDIGRPTSGSAIGLRGKSHLYRGNWAAAQADFEQLVGSGLYSLLPADRYMENFTETNENNEESVFELQYLGVDAFAWGVDIPGVGTMGNFHIDYAPPMKSPDQSHYVNSWVRELFEANGETIRRDATIAYDYPGSTGYGGVPFTDDFAAEITLANDEGMEPIYTRKYAGMDIGVRDDVDFLGTNVGNNWRIIRYADILLMHAEALNNQGMTSQAATFVNMVRERAGVSTISSSMSQDDMTQAIIDERVLELTGESHRFFDLVRWGLADEYLGQNSLHGDHPKSLSGGIFQENRHEYIWIPLSEIGANPNISQNPGY